MSFKTTLNNWNPERQTLDAEPLRTVNRMRWQRGQLDRVVSTVSSMIRANQKNIFTGVTVEKVAALGQVIHKTKNLSALDKKVLVQILKHLYEPYLTLRSLEEILECGVSWKTIERFFEASRLRLNLLLDPQPVLRILDKTSDEEFKGLMDQASQFNYRFIVTRALYLLANTPPSSRAKLIRIHNEFMRGVTNGTPKLCLEWEPEDWLKIQSSWIGYLVDENLERLEIGIALFLKDPTLLSTACQLDSHFHMRFQLLLAIDAVKQDQREAMVVLCQLLSKGADLRQLFMILESLRQQTPTFQDLLNRIQALPRTHRARHIQKIGALGYMSAEQLQGLLAIPIDQFDKALKRAKPCMEKKIDLLITFGSMHAMPPQEVDEVVAQSRELATKQNTFDFSKCLHLLGLTPRESRNRFRAIFTRLTANHSPYLNQFLADLPAHKWLHIEESWIDYAFGATHYSEEAEILKLFLEHKTLLPFAEKLKPMFGAKLSVVKLLAKCASDTERTALVEAVTLLGIVEGSSHVDRCITTLEYTDIPLSELPTHIRTLKEEVDCPDILLAILNGFNKEEPDYFKKALALLKGLDDTDAERFSRKFIEYKHPLYAGIYDLTLSLIDENMTLDERREIFHALSKCPKKDRGPVVELVKTFQIKLGIGAAIRVIEENLSYSAFLIPQLNPLDRSDAVKVALLTILTGQYKKEDCKLALTYLLSLLSEDSSLDRIARNLNVNLKTLASYSQLLKNIHPAPLKMTLFSLIYNRPNNYKKLLPLLLSLTDGVTHPEEIAIIKELFNHPDLESFVKVILQATPSKDFRLFLIDSFITQGIEELKKIILFINKTLKGSEHFYTPVVQFIISLKRRERVEICDTLMPYLEDAPIEIKLEIFKALKDLERYDILSILKNTPDYTLLLQKLKDFRVLLDLDLSSANAVDVITKVYLSLEGVSAESRILSLKQKGCYQLVVQLQGLEDPVLESWFLNADENLETLAKALTSIPKHLLDKYKVEILSLIFPHEKDGAIIAQSIDRMRWFYETLETPNFPKEHEKLVLNWFNTTTSHFDFLARALQHSVGFYNEILPLFLSDMPNGANKAVAIEQHRVLFQLKKKFPNNEALLASLVFSTTTHINALLNLSLEFLEHGLPLLKGLTDGKEKLSFLNAIADLQPNERLPAIQYAVARIDQTTQRKALLRQGVYYSRILKESPLPEKAKGDLQKLLTYTHLDYETIRKQIHATRMGSLLIEVLLAECLALQNLDYKKRDELIDHFFDQLDIYLPLIMERPLFVHYLIRHHYYQMQEAIAQKEYPLHIQALLIPFLKPSQIIKLDLDEGILKKPILSGERSWPNPASAFEELQKGPNINLILSEFGEEGFIQAIPFAALALLAKKKPELLLPYLTYFGDLQLAATLPFLEPHRVAQETLSLPRLIMLTKRAPVSLKELLVARITPTQNSLQIQQIETFYKACQEGDPYPIPPTKLEELLAAKEALESEVDASPNFDIPPRYQDCTTFEVMTDPIRLPSNGKYVDRTTFDRFEKNGDQVKNIDNLFYPSTEYKSDPKLKKELKCIDKYTGQVMEKPLKVPPDYILHIDASVLNQLEKNEKGLKSPFDYVFYPEDSYLPDPELEAWLNEYSNDTDD